MRRRGDRNACAEAPRKEEEREEKEEEEEEKEGRDIFDRVMGVCVHVCVSERKRKKEGGREREKERKSGREREEKNNYACMTE